MQIVLLGVAQWQRGGKPKPDRSQAPRSASWIPSPSGCPREEVERALDERQYEEEVLMEVMEQEAESEELYQKRLGAYREQLEEWKVWRRQQVGLQP